MFNAGALKRNMKFIVTLILGVVMLVGMAACSDSVSDTDIDYIARIEGSRPFNASHGITITLGDVVNRFFDSPSWSYIQQENGADVEIRGTLLVSGEPVIVNARVRITSGGEVGMSFPSASVGGEQIASNQDEVKAFLLPMFIEYESE